MKGFRLFDLRVNSKDLTFYDRWYFLKLVVIFDNQDQPLFNFSLILFKLKIELFDGVAFSFLKDLGVTFYGRGLLFLILKPLFNIPVSLHDQAIFKLLMTFYR